MSGAAREGLLARASSDIPPLRRKTSSFAPSFRLIGFGGSVSAFGAPLSVQSLGSQASKASFADDATHSEATTATGDSDEDEPVNEEVAKAYAFNSVALPALHFAVGVLNNLQGVAWRQFLIHDADGGAGLDPADQALVGGVVGALPWNLKILVAFTSDVWPCCGLRRKPYLLLGLMLQGGAWLLLGMLGRAASFQLIAGQQFCAVMGQMVVGVMCDALIVENVGCERGATVGRLQTTCQMFFAAGGLAGTLLAGILPQFCGLSNAMVFAVRGAAALALAPPALALLREAPRRAPRADAAAEGGAGDGAGACGAVARTAADVWAAMQQLRVFKPLVFIFVFAACPASTDAFNTYLLQQTPLCAWRGAAGCADAAGAAAADATSIGSYCASVPNATHAGGGAAAAAACDAQWGGAPPRPPNPPARRLGFDDVTYTAVGLLGSVGSVLGNWLFRRYLLRVSWHIVFVATVLLAAAASSLQLLLMFRDAASGATLAERLRMPDVAFALGDDVVVATANQLLAMPILILMARLCAPGAEGTTYALVTSVQMVGGTVGGIFSQIATARFGVTNVAFGALWKLTLFSATAKLAALPLLPLVPASVDAVAHERRSSPLAGAAVLAAFVGGLGWAVAQIITTLQ